MVGVACGCVGVRPSNGLRDSELAPCLKSLRIPDLDHIKQYVSVHVESVFFQLSREQPQTVREIGAIFAGALPTLHVQPPCRCPGSHPRVHPLHQRYCIPNDAEDTTRDRVSRLHPEAHPLSFVNDDDVGTAFTPYSHGNVTFSLLAPGPNHRPGYNDFYNSQSLQEFVKATQVRLHFHGQYYTTETPASLRHRYYAVSEVTITGRCQCHGHADSCDTTSQPYRCLCSRESFTGGLQCDRCLPLYNDKPFRQGDQVHAFSCKPCQCHSHSRSCHYDSSEDPFPSEHHRGGGGVCDDCEHNTTGRNCELCKEYFFRPAGADPSATDVCQPCECDAAGTRNGSLLCDQMGGQCDCKRRASGRRCNQCQDGFFNLHKLDPDGCSPCNCNTSGTEDGDITCHPHSGQCTCKANVTGLRCDRCRLGFKFLPSFRDGGCAPCRCNPFGSVSRLCDPLSGQCECRADARGLRCDTCREHFYGLDVTGCQACGCHPAGSLPGTVCALGQGSAIASPALAGDSAMDVWRDPSTSNRTTLSSACPATVIRRDRQCPCKPGVTGLRCSQCGPHRYNLTAGDFQGCGTCECDPSGTLPGTMCDPSSGQCRCLPNRQGRRCDQCQPERPGKGCEVSREEGSVEQTELVMSSELKLEREVFYISPGNATGCLPCSCRTAGAAHHICNSRTGQCVCQDASTAGLSCDRCRDLYFGFDPQTGRCQPCNCHLSGALNETCHLVTGRCFCKRFVTGSTCDTCVPGASHLDASNPWGCSKTPSQQPPPRGQVQSSSAINLSWSPPDSPNAHWLTYSLFRDGTEIYTTEDQYPYDIQNFLDTALSPYTSYSYSVETSNVQGSTRSAAVTYRTRPGVPEGTLNLSYVIPVGSDSVTLTWTAASNRAGPVEKYLLWCTPFNDTQPCVPHEGRGTSATVWNLLPFTQYRFSVQACTGGGCLHSSPVTVTTAQAPPRGLGPPAVRAISSTELRVEWAPPMEPNGRNSRPRFHLLGPDLHENLRNLELCESLANPRIIVRYELYMRRLRSDGEPTSAESRVFESSGWLSPRPLAESANENALRPPPAATTIRGLEPYTTYEFRVWAGNMAGSVSSPWASGQTGESEPISMAPPSVSPLSPHSLNVSWEKPADNVTRGDVVGYEISMISEQSPQQPAPVVFSQVLARTESQQLSYIVSGLKPYRIYNFTVSLCNSVGCVASASGAGQTLPAAPAQLRPPSVEGVSGTAIRARWLPPAEPNGPAPVYQLERRETSLPAPGARAEKGVRFPGHGYYTFPSSTHPVNTGFTGIKASFRTRVPEGLLVFAASPGNQEEYFALQLKHGRPYFLFDPQGSSVEVTTTNDDGKQYSDGKWHDIVAVRHQAFGWITLDGQYTGSSGALNGSTVIGENAGVFVGGLPWGYAVLRKDAGFLELDPGTFHGGLDFEISFKFRTDQLNGLLLFVYNKDGPDFLAVELKSGILSLRLNTSLTFTRVDLWLGLSYCDGTWNTVTVRKEGALVSASLNELMERVSQPRAQPLAVNSPVYLGGVPPELQDSHTHLGLEPGFGGCMRDVAFERGTALRLASVSSGAVRVNLDGCLSSDSAVNCRGNDSILVYRGPEPSAQERGLQPFTEYLYRVMASHEGGSVWSDWSRGRTTGAELIKSASLPGSLYSQLDRVAGVLSVGDQAVFTAQTPALRLRASSRPLFTLSPWKLALFIGLNGEVRAGGCWMWATWSDRPRQGPGVREQPQQASHPSSCRASSGLSSVSPAQSAVMMFLLIRPVETPPRSVPAPSRVRSINGSSVEVAWDEPVEVRGVIEKYILRACPEGGVPGPPRTPCATSELVHTSNLTVFREGGC
ncbi:hypothetical protein QTO34_012514 [Cnephaeus nilssonii]|uniref:Usherin n=1 Tax=Cnephaeus nilssonii TaxID=3371016 RepID=A0AA40HBE7_CNENI|nr:hypothetical protein QTO34_012514 [Eptesicus nilssonii]